MAENLNYKANLDPKGFQEGMRKVEEAGKKTAEHLSHHYNELGSIIRRAVGWAGAYIALEKGIDLASEQIKLQKVQAQLITNNNLKQAQFVGHLVGWTKQTKDGLQTSDRWYSSALDAQANKLSLLTGISKNQFIHAQNLILPNKDLGKLLAANKGTMDKFLLSAANMSDIMGGGGEGSIVGSARILTRVLTDPAHRMSALVRTGVSLSKQEQQRIKAVEATQGLLAAQEMLLAKIQEHTKNVAVVSRSPIERLKNDMSLLKQSLGVGLIPILEAMAKALEPLVVALQPAFEAMAEVIKKTAESLGESLGKILGLFTPILKGFVESFLPGILTVFNTILKAVADIAEPLSKALIPILDPKTGIGKAFTDMANQIAKNLMPAVEELARAFGELFSDKKFQQDLIDMFTSLAPILPQLTIAVTEFLKAITPGIVFLMPYFVKFVTFLAKISAWFATGVAEVAKFAGKIMDFFNHFAIGKVLVAGFFLFFHKKILDFSKLLISLVFSPLTKSFGLLKKIMGLGGGSKVAGGAIDAVESAVLGGGGKKGGLFSKVMGLAGGTLTMGMGPLVKKVLGGKGIVGDIEKAVGKKTFLRNALGQFAGGYSTNTKDPMVNLTHAIINLTNVILKRGIGGGGGSGSGSGGITDLLDSKSGGAVKKMEDKLLSRFGGGRLGKIMDRVHGGKIGQMLEKVSGGRFGNALEKFAGGKGGNLLGNLGSKGAGLLEKFGGSKIGGLLGKMGGKSAAGWLGRIGGGALAEGLGLGALEGMGAMIPGIGWALSAGLLAFQFRKQIGHALGFSGRMKTPTSDYGFDKNGHYFVGAPKMHSGGYVGGMSGQEVPAILQAGEAVLSARTVRNLNRSGGVGGGLNIHPNAVNVVVNGNADAQTVALIKHHIDLQFKEFHRTLRTMGR